MYGLPDHGPSPVRLLVVAHGLTSSPLAARYGAHAARLDSQQPEHAPVQAVRTRAFAGTPGTSTRAEAPSP